LASSAVDRLAASIGELAGAEVELERPPERQPGDYATNVALRTAKAAGRPPRELAEELAGKAESLPEVERAEVAGPGFVNLHVSNEFLAATLAEIGEGYGSGSAAPTERIQVEMVSANPTGPVTVASARNGAYGDSVARLLEFAGHAVSREYYWNDAGRQVELFRASVEAVRRGNEPPEGGYRGEYVAELAKLEGDPVTAMLEEIVASLERFRIRFDSFVREVELVAEVPAAIAALDTYEAEGTLWARTSAFGDNEDRPLLRSSDGSHLYFAADVAYLRRKLERFDRAIYVLGADHHGYVARLKAAASMLGYDAERLEVLLYQLVHLTRGGEKVKMGKRSGNVVFLDELIDEVGVDAARWYLVNRGPDQTIDIDVDLAAEKSQKNPVYYVQYAHARIAGILRQAGAPGGEGGVRSCNHADAATQDLTPEERNLIKRLIEFPEVLSDATAKRGPQSLPAYAIKVADDFHRFYTECRVLGSEQEAFRLSLCRATRIVIAQCLQLVGVAAPERM
jgi:arginyl-tRNA synthetase